jgi:plastocyanin
MLKHCLMTIAGAGLIALSLLLLNPRSVGAGSVVPQVVTVEIHNFAFQPATVTVHPGDTVEWKNEDSAAHTATAETPKPGFDSGAIQSGAKWRYDARDKGTYNYICTFHRYMKGQLIVQ